MLTNYGLVGLVGGRGPEPTPQFLIEVWRAAWSMTPASHSNQETAGNPGSNPGGRTIISFQLAPLAIFRGQSIYILPK